MPGSFADDVAGFAEGGCHAVEVWLTKLETAPRNAIAAADTRKLLDDHHMTLAAAAYQGGLLLSQGEQRRAHFDHFNAGSTCASRSPSRPCSWSPTSSRRWIRRPWSGPSCRWPRPPAGPQAFDVRLGLEFRGQSTSRPEQNVERPRNSRAEPDAERPAQRAASASDTTERSSAC